MEQNYVTITLCRPIAPLLRRLCHVLDDGWRHRAKGAGRRGRSLQCTIALSLLRKLASYGSLVHTCTVQMGSRCIPGRSA